MRENNLPVVALGSAATGIRTQVHVIQKNGGAVGTKQQHRQLTDGMWPRPCSASKQHQSTARFTSVAEDKQSVRRWWGVRTRRVFNIAFARWQSSALLAFSAISSAILVLDK